MCLSERSPCSHCLYSCLLDSTFSGAFLPGWSYVSFSLLAYVGKSPNTALERRGVAAGLWGIW